MCFAFSSIACKTEQICKPSHANYLAATLSQCSGILCRSQTKVSCPPLPEKAEPHSVVLLNGNSEYHYSLLPAVTDAGSAVACAVGDLRALGVSRLNCRILYSSAL